MGDARPHPRKVEATRVRDLVAGLGRRAGGRLWLVAASGGARRPSAGTRPRGGWRSARIQPHTGIFSNTFPAPRHTQDGYDVAKPTHTATHLLWFFTPVFPNQPFTSH